MKIAIVGSRDFPNLDLVVKEVQRLANEDPELVIISGGAKGVDITAETEARRLGVKCTIFLPDWHLHGKSAGMIRNYDIVNACDRVIAFWDGKSRGTQHTINIADRQNKVVIVIVPEVNNG